MKLREQIRLQIRINQLDLATKRLFFLTQKQTKTRTKNQVDSFQDSHERGDHFFPTLN